MEKIRILRGLDKKRIIFHEDNIIIEKNLLGTVVSCSIYRYLSKKLDLFIQFFVCEHK
jgi:hypothetical protein